MGGGLEGVSDFVTQVQGELSTTEGEEGDG